MSTTAEPSAVEDGGRVDVRRVDADPHSDEFSRVVYDAVWTLPDRKLSGRVLVVMEDPTAETSKQRNISVAIDSSGELPEWLEDFTRTLLRTIARSVGPKRPFPRRLSRWRDNPPN